MVNIRRLKRSMSLASLAMVTALLEEKNGRKLPRFSGDTQAEIDKLFERRRKAWKDNSRLDPRLEKAAMLQRKFLVSPEFDGVYVVESEGTFRFSAEVPDTGRCVYMPALSRLLERYITSHNRTSIQKSTEFMRPYLSQLAARAELDSLWDVCEWLLKSDMGQRAREVEAAARVMRAERLSDAIRGARRAEAPTLRVNTTLAAQLAAALRERRPRG